MQESSGDGDAGRDGRDERTGSWLVLTLHMPAPGEEFLMVDALRRLGARAIEPEGESVAAWFPPPDDVDAWLQEVRLVLRASTSIADPAPVWRWQPHEEWVERWVSAVEPRRVTDRIVVAPIGRELEGTGGPDPRDVVIRLEAGVAFGTAEHATTRGCLRLLERLLQRGDRVLDIGTGSGVLAIAAALLGARDVLALEADALSCASARRNVVANGVGDRVTVRHLTVGPSDLRRPGGRELILANLEAGLIRDLLPGLAGALAPSGCVIVAGMTGGERTAVLAAAAAAGLDVKHREAVDGWLSLALARRAWHRAS